MSLVWVEDTDRSEGDYLDGGAGGSGRMTFDSSRREKSRLCRYRYIFVDEGSEITGNPTESLAFLGRNGSLLP